MGSCAAVAHRLALHLLASFALQRALQRLVERGFYAVVFLLRDVAPFVFDFQLEKFFFQPLQQHGRGTAGGTSSEWQRAWLAPMGML